MIRTGLFILLLLSGATFCAGEQVVVDFDKAPTVLPDGIAVRLPQWEDKGVVFTLAHEPRQSKGKGLVMFFTHLASGKKGIVCAMATEPIPVRATFPKPVSSVSLEMWGSTTTPAVLEAFDSDGNVVDHKSLDAVPGRKTPNEPVPVFTMTVSARRITYIQFSGPREGEFLAANEVRFTPVENEDQK
jgi:hypothetical protein